ncbi:MAG: ComEC/Rec2 family competence protein [candidate division WOR-3 bacterium]
MVIVALLSAINTNLRKAQMEISVERDFVYEGVVISEDQRDNKTKLKIAIKRVITRNDTIPLAINIEHYTYQRDCFLGKTVKIRGRLVPAKKVDQPNIISGTIIEKNYDHSFIGRIFNNVYGYINNTLRNFFEPDYCGIAQGLILGGSNRLNKELKTIFARAGVLHILAVSGLHIGFIIAFLGAIFLFVPIPRTLKFLMIMLFLLFYAGITGFRPSVLRASLMAFLFGLSFILQRQVNAMHIVNIGALILLLINPLMLFDTGAQLSFAAVYGIVYLLPKVNIHFLKNIKIRILKPILWSMATSFSAQVFVSPFLVHYFGQLPTLAVFSNLLIVPLASIIIYLLFILIIASLFFVPLAKVISILIGKMIWVLQNIASFFASLPFSSINITLPVIFLVLFFFVFVNKTRKFAVFAICILAIVFSLISLIPVSTISMTDNAALITLSNGERVLIMDRDSKFLPESFTDGRITYLIAPERTIEVDKEFVPIPDDLYYKTLRIGDFSIHIEKNIDIQWHKMSFDVPENGFDNRIINIVLGRKGIYEFETPAEISVFDQIAIDFQRYYGYLRVFLGAQMEY